MIPLLGGHYEQAAVLGNSVTEETPVSSSLHEPVKNAGKIDQNHAARWPLESLNFFMADMQSGIGPFLGVFLQGYGWVPAPSAL